MDQNSLKHRAKAWLTKEKPDAAAIKSAYEAMQRKIDAGKVSEVDDADGALESLAEAYVSAGGEIDDLLCDSKQAAQPDTAQTTHPTHVQHSFDSSPLIPEVSNPASALSAEQKLAAFAELKQKLGNITPGGAHELSAAGQRMA